LILFDIDETLLLTGKIGQTSVRLAFEETFGLVGSFDHYYPSGRTMESILIDTLLDLGRSEEEYLFKRKDFYHRFFAEFDRHLENGNHHIRPLEEGVELVQTLNERKDTIVGLATGNHRHTAQLKLTKAGYDFETFVVGRFGDQSGERAELIRIAKNQAAILNSMQISNLRPFVVGDTIRDINAAKSAGVHSIAVCTGDSSKYQLAPTEPDYLLENLSNQNIVSEAIFSEK
jgi:phosphoglycolate phosphatase-like HAD superfamily hydrolase